ncbi:MAG: EF-P 5-aminopentanol modification-associated protein YfmH [Butyricicoccaceae bacterium]
MPDIQTIHAPALHDMMYTAQLENGLTLFYIPRPSLSKTFAIFATNFGSVDSCFTVDGVRHDTTAGIAHFLEHKMFEEEDGNALQKFTEAGAQPNAFTSHTMTAYHFTCTDGFQRNLETLLHFVSTPYFTDENVEKEKGIIGQEIGMLDDTPGWQAYVGVLQGLYANHTVRISIAGSVQSISVIDPATLYLCHKAFYSPSNMVLVVCGTCDFEEVIRTAERILPKESTHIAAREYGAEDRFAAQSEVVREMAVSQPLFMAGWKDVPVGGDETVLHRQIVGELAAQCLCGESAPLYAKLYAEGLTNRSLATDYFTFPEGACMLIDGESRDPQAVREAIQAEIERIAREGVDPVLFERVKKASYGTRVRRSDEPSEVGRMQTEAFFGGGTMFDYAEIYQNLTADDVTAFLGRYTDARVSTMAVIRPLEQ